MRMSIERNVGVVIGAGILAWVGLAASRAASHATTDAATGVSPSSTEPRVHVRTEPLETADPGATYSARPEPVLAHARSVVSRGRFTSYQVNVAPGQLNIVNDAANEPSIAVDPTNSNRIAVGWRQFNTITSSFRQAGRAYSSDRGLTWTFPGVINPGVFRSDPVLAADSAGNFYYSSLRTTNPDGSGDFLVEVYKSLDGGQTWGAPVPAFGGDKQWFTIDNTGGIGDGNIYQVWNSQFSGIPWAGTDFTRSINGGASFQTPLPMPNPRLKWGTLDVGPSGELYIVGATLNQSGQVLVKSSTAQNTAITPTFDFAHNITLGGISTGGPPNPAGLLGQVQVAVNRSNTAYKGEVYVLGSVSPAIPDPLDVMFIRSTDGGQTFSTPIRVNDDPLLNDAFNWFGTFSVAPNGRIDVIWNDTRNDPDPGNASLSEGYYRYSLDGGRTWYPGEPFTPQWNHFAGWPQQQKIGDYYHSVSENGGMMLAYAATFNGEEDVYFARLTPDCNANGIADETDIANLTSADCNGNLTPDECEPNLDCNNNSVQDICDVAGGGSGDCNMNQVPDECEGALDCNNNTIADFCDIASGTSEDCNVDGIPDECQLVPDCNNNLVPDACDLVLGTSADCNANDVPDECDISSGSSQDANSNEIPDECEGACCLCGTCNITTRGTCVSQNGAFYQGQSCSGFTCPNPDLCANKLALPSLTTVSVPFSNVCANNDGPANVNCDNGTQPFGTDLWYSYVAPCCGQVTFSLCTETNFDAILALYGGGAACTCPAVNTPALSCSDDSCGGGGGAATITRSVTANQCITVRVGGFGGAVGHGELNVTAVCDPVACGASNAPNPEPVIIAKNRYLSVVPTNAGQQTALRVTLTSLPAPFSAFNGQTRWVAAPDTLQEDSIPPSTFKVAKLVCNPVYRDWGAEGPIHVFGDAIVPNGQYAVRAIRSGCVTTNECNLSPALPVVTTPKWGDVVAPFAADGATGQPNFQDINALVVKFQSSATAIVKVRADIQPDEPDRIVNFQDISADVRAFQSQPYPFDGPSSCP